MKKLLLFSLLVAGSFTANAQYDCTDATVISDNGTITAPDVAGTFVSGVCYTHAFDNTGSGDMYGLWYSFTPASNGVVDITSDLPQNVAPFSDDTKISIFTGTCDALECYDANDDTSGTNYLSTISFPVAAGVTYYIQWDNYWSGAGFDFNFTFTPQTCVKPYYFNVSNVTTSSMTLGWDNSVSNPAQYEVEYGLSGFVQGAGTVVQTSTNSVDLSGLVVGGDYDFYVRGVCGSEFSEWSDLVSYTLPVVCPYASGLDTNDQITGWTAIGYSFSTTSAQSQSAPNFLYTTSSQTAALNSLLSSRPLLLQANEAVTMTFYTRLSTASAGITPHTLKVYANTRAVSTTGATQLGANITVGTATYTLQTRTFTAPSAGIYYFTVNDVTPIVSATAVSQMRIDTFNFTSVLGTNEYLASNITTYPNPAKNVINISNGLNAVIESIELTDLNGRVVKTQNINATEGQVSISDLSAGVYMMKVSTDQGVATKKVVKQ